MLTSVANRIVFYEWQEYWDKLYVYQGDYKIGNLVEEAVGPLLSDMMMLLGDGDADDEEGITPDPELEEWARDLVEDYERARDKSERDRIAREACATLMSWGPEEKGSALHMMNDDVRTAIMWEYNNAESDRAPWGDKGPQQAESCWQALSSEGTNLQMLFLEKLLIATVEGVKRVLFDGGPSRKFNPDMHSSIQNDITIVLRDFFINEEDGVCAGLRDVLVDHHTDALARPVLYMREDTEALIDLYTKVFTKNPEEKEILAKVLLHRIQDDGKPDIRADEFYVTTLKEQHGRGRSQSAARPPP